MIVRIKGLRLQATLGVTPAERSATRLVVIHIDIEFDGRRAAVSDDVHETIDYKVVRNQVMAAVERDEYRLIESLVHTLVCTLSEDTRVQRLQVEVEKPDALRLADSVSVLAHWRRTAAP